MTKFIQHSTEVEAWKVEDILLASINWENVPALINMYYMDGNITFKQDSILIKTRDSDLFEAPKDYWIVYDHGFFYVATPKFFENNYSPEAGPVDEGFVGIEKELSWLINKYSAESVSGTPDFVLAKFLLESLKTFNEAVSARAEWRGETCEYRAGRAALPVEK